MENLDIKYKQVCENYVHLFTFARNVGSLESKNVATAPAQNHEQLGERSGWLMKQSTDLSSLIIPLYHRLSLPNYNTAFWCAKLFLFLCYGLNNVVTRHKRTQ